jgi:hypothetical protein
MTSIQIEKITEEPIPYICYYGADSLEGHEIKIGDYIIFIHELTGWSDGFCKKHTIEYLNNRKNEMDELIDKINKSC